jgi:hypothetical protein
MDIQKQSAKKNIWIEERRNLEWTIGYLLHDEQHRGLLLLYTVTYHSD